MNDFMEQYGVIQEPGERKLVSVKVGEILVASFVTNRPVCVQDLYVADIRILPTYPALLLRVGALDSNAIALLNTAPGVVADAIAKALGEK